MTGAPRDARRKNVEELLRKRILTAELGPGQHINESRVAGELGVSRTPVREALLRLEGQRLVRFDQGRGFFAAPLSADEVRETYPIIAQLELLAVTTTGPVLRTLVPRLTEINADFRAAEDPARSHACDAEFHRTLVSRCGNSRLLGLLDRLWQTIRRYEYGYLADEDDHRRSGEQHESIVAAIAADDFARAAREVHDNTLGSMHPLLERLGQG
ncbi:GntR family transcriptional regulator [Amycolatopsis anabasis]|uniref:GntR family transcriptional regulator n=1 Tax=Amycolatopsis anabasis TaxID=1840409 RepID=UPI00131CC728|nr:GntR family transcriptional regulator [Amycolatopsis anabasis]